MDIADIDRQFQRGLPMVLCDWQENESSLTIPQVRVDFHYAGKLAAQHLSSLGHRKIGIIVDEPQQTLRLEGFRAALQEEQIDQDVKQLADMKVDLVKVWVDDHLGKDKKIPLVARHARA